jgi:hypothetical protein
MDDEHTLSFFMNAHAPETQLGVDRFSGNPTLRTTSDSVDVNLGCVRRTPTH